MKCMKVGQLKHTGRVALLVASVFASSVAAAANYWKGVDGADLATPANWSDEALPTGATGYFNGRSEHGTDYTATLSADTSLYQLIWGGSGTAAKSTVLDLGGHTLTMTVTGARPIRIEKDGQSVTFTNGVLSFPSETAWVLSKDQTLTFGEGLTLNGSAAIHAAGTNPSTNSMIVVKDGAKVNGMVYFNSLQSSGTILVTGEGTVIDANGSLALGLGSTASNNTFRVENGAVVTNLSDASAVDVGYSSQSRGNRFVVDSGASLHTKDWNVSGATAHAYLGKAGVSDGGNEIFVGDGAQFNTRVFYIYGNGNTLSVSNGTFRAVKFELAGTNTFHFAGAAPLIYQTGSNGLNFGDGSEYTFRFDVPATGWANAPMDFNPGGDHTVKENTKLVVDAAQYARNGGGTVPLATYRGTRTITFSETLLSRWNSELAAQNCSVAYDSSARTLSLTVKKASGLAIFVR